MSDEVTTDTPAETVEPETAEVTDAVEVETDTSPAETSEAPEDEEETTDADDADDENDDAPRVFTDPDSVDE